MNKYFFISHDVSAYLMFCGALACRPTSWAKGRGEIKG